MNAFDPIAFARKLEAKGMKRDLAETLATETRSAMLELVTQEQLKAALDRQTIQLAGIFAGLLAVAITLSKAFT